ncbi:MAG: hypothetical protein ABI761_05805 [Saprospiraceae bacterium]
MGKASCPSPGPPCYTFEGSIKWNRRYFENPIVSDVEITAQILDMDSTTVLINFIPEKIAGIAPFFYYVSNIPVLPALRGKREVIFRMTDPTGVYSFVIKKGFF